MGRMPRHRKVERLPEDVAVAEEAFYRCPRGHLLPHRSEAGQCTPIYCALEEGAVTQPLEKHRKPRKKSAEEQASRKQPPIDEADALSVQHGDLVTSDLVVGEDVDSEALAMASKTLSKRATWALARAKYMKTPVGLEGQAAEEHFDKKMVELLPLAAAEIEYQLLHGDDAQRMQAVAKVTDATGRSRKEVASQAGATIIIKGNIELPWLKQAKAVEVVDAIPSKALVTGGNTGGKDEAV